MAIVPSIGSGLGQTTMAAQQVYRKAMGYVRTAKRVKSALKGPKKRKKKGAIDRAAGAAKRVVRAAGKAKRIAGKLKKGSAAAKAAMAKLRKMRKK
jgi:hypothetical protein